jgi:AraC-like DNA-binding protein
MGLDMSNYETEYMPDKQPDENMNSLRNMLDQMFLQISRKRDGLVTSIHNQVLEWIRENAFDPDLCVASIGEHFSLSKNKVYDLVRSATDMGLNEYLLSIRMKKAGNLLYSTQLSVGEVASQCGYLAESTFYRVFKKYFGLTPVQYRQNGTLPENE